MLAAMTRCFRSMARPTILATAGFLTAAGCSSGSSSCESDEDCPPRFYCISNQCVDGGGNGEPDAGSPDGGPGTDTTSDGDAGSGSDDGGCSSGTPCVNPVQPGCGNEEVCGDGLDNNCDGAVDEACICNPGDVQPCFRGPPGHRGVGNCEDGHQVCILYTDYGYWGPCEGGIAVSTEVCDGVDNDCNGCADEDLCCSGELDCPGPGDPRIPDVVPFSTVTFHGSDFYKGPAQSWRWEVVGTPCDQLLKRTVNRTSYDIEGENTEELRLQFRLSGDYQITMTATDLIGNEHSCTFIIHVKGTGMRIELCWDTTGDVDLDLHLHRPASMEDWYDPVDDCHWDNCTADRGVDWGYDSTDLANCVNGPQGAKWAEVGACRNPRLDMDNRGDVGIPENINVDNPKDGDTFRVAVVYYRGSRVSHPVLNVYCGGRLTGTYGVYPDDVDDFIDMVDEPLWRVVDVTTHVVGQDHDNTSCDVDPLRDPADPSRYWVTTGDLSY